ncbi:alpha/beta hydrolase [Flavobacterium agrisoli]|uniref:Alpha/beta hydrolase n=1 Tax=Flavobacterium agrisoli TaxID=2793066 RepID=A0A934PQI2_9FLAO|nr:alpha/beta hydrolase [Flavobacterium agrisoli]MBK0370746.1 alpha/beta hydrolase [Flavobacterium agrisoli]
MKKIPFLLFVLGFCLTFGGYAQQKTINLWSSKIPNSIEAKDYAEKPQLEEDGTVKSTSQVAIPTLSIFEPENGKSNGTAVLIFPGGGYTHLAMNKEGFKVAKWFNSLGITAFVLKYRLPNDLIATNKTIAPLQDAQEAMRYIRSNAKKWNLDTNKIGVLGFSAGGHLGATIATHFEDKVYEPTTAVSARPDFSILVYPVITMNEKYTHMGSRNALLGKNPTQETIEKYSGELQVSANTPPTFLIHATDDGAVPVENSINYYMAFKQHKVSAEMHVYKVGGHGFGLGVKDTSLYWPVVCENWLKSLQLIP